MTTAPDTDAAPPPENASIAPPTLPPTVTSAPRKPAVEQSNPEADSAPSHPPVPQISPQLSPTDAAAYQRKTGEDIAVAEGNLRQTNGKRLNAAQSDLTEKIRSF